MKKLMTFFAVYAMAFLFGVLFSASPEAAAAEKPNIQKCENFSASAKTETAQTGFVKISHEQESVEVVAPSPAALRNHVLQTDAGITIKNSFGRTKNETKLAKFERITYESPPDKFFTGAGFDVQARAKI